jgi:hypothetical protein
MVNRLWSKAEAGPFKRYPLEIGTMYTCSEHWNSAGEHLQVTSIGIDKACTCTRDE